MRDLIFTMTQAFVAQPDRQHKLIGKQRGPEFNIGFIRKAPAVVAALRNAPLHCARQIYAPEFVLTAHPRDHAIAEAMAGAYPGYHAIARGKCRSNQRRGADSGGNPVESLATAG